MGEAERKTSEVRREPTIDPAPPAPGFTIITGLSGAGRSEAAKLLEDLGYFVVDNLPSSLLPKLAELAARPGGPNRVAVVLDVRGGVFFGELSRALEELDMLNIDHRILYLEASDEDLVNRYAATRHRHPLAPGDRVIEGRFLPNPHWIDELRPLPGTDDRVRRYVRGQQTYREFMRRLRALLGFMVPGFVAEGKSYLTIAVGCTGGRHRSVVVVDDLATFFGEKGLPTSVEHRDLDR